MRVLEICRSLPTHQAGGLEWHAYDLTCAMEELGARVTVLTTPAGAGEPLAPLNPSGGLRTLGTVPGRYTWQFFRELPERVAAICEEEKIDVIHAQGFAGIPIILRPRPGTPPVVTTIHGTLYSETPLRRERFARLGMGERLATSWRPPSAMLTTCSPFKHRLAFSPLWRRFLRAGPSLVVDSQFTRRELHAELGRAVEATVVQLGIDLSRAWARTRFEAREELVLDTDGTIFLLVGRLEALKGQALALEAVARAAMHPEFKVPQPWRVIVAGDGPEKANLIALTRRLNIAQHVTFPGRIPADKLTRMYAAADVFMNPDFGAPAFGLVTAESLLAGTPVVAMDSGATGEVLTSERDGILVPDDPAHLAGNWTEALLRLAARLPEPANQRFERAERAAARFNRRDMARTMLAHFESVAHRRR